MREGRFVWITSKQCDWLLVGAKHLFDEELTVLLDVIEAWEAAPDDSVETVVEWFNTHFAGAEEEGDSVRNGATEILRALGMPE